MPQTPPEFAAVIRRIRFQMDHAVTAVMDCRNGRLVTLSRYGFPKDDKISLFSPLHPRQGATALPDPGVHASVMSDGGQFLYRHFVLVPEDKVLHRMTCIAVIFIPSKTHGIRVNLSESQAAGTWTQGRTSDWIKLPERFKKPLRTLLAHGKLYMICMAGYILCLDPSSLSFFCIKLPDGVEYYEDHDAKNIASCRAEGAGFFLIHVKGSRMSVWMHTTGCSAGDWKLVDSLCLHQVFGQLADPSFRLSQDTVFRVVATGDNADFVFLEIEQRRMLFYLHIRSRAVEKVFELQSFLSGFKVDPFMMVWPPNFPTRNDECDLN